MSLEAILEAIRAEAETGAGRVVDDARREADRLIEAARSDAEERVRTAASAAEPGLRAEAVRIVNAARLRRLREQADAAAAATDAAWTEAERRLDEVVDDPSAEGRWPRALLGLAGEALATAGAGASIETRPTEAGLLRELAEGRGARLVTRPGAAPGVIVRSADGSLEIDATLPARLGRARRALAAEVAELLGQLD
jgi:vacuolar-type H+-ATPase subunit E/Vma4